MSVSGMEAVCDLRKLEKAYRKVMHGKRGKTAAIRFSINVLEGLCVLKWQLEHRTYSLGEYTEFSVERPVHRDVKTCALKDKIVLGSLSKNELWPKISPHLIDDNYASRVGMGTHLALDRLEANLHRHYINHGTQGYVLRIDVKKYFYNLPHDAVMDNFRKYGFDDWTLWLCRTILDSSNHSVKHGYIDHDRRGNMTVSFFDMIGAPSLEVGSPIGNETSQVFAVEYISSIDHFIKDQLGVKAYGRYMDDSYIIHHDRQYLEWVLKEVEKRYNDLGLELNHKTQIQPLKNGVPFLGMHLYLTDTGKVIRRLRPANVRYARVHIKENAKAVANGSMTVESFWNRYKAWDNHASYADAKHIRRQMLQYAKEEIANAQNSQ